MDQDSSLQGGDIEPPPQRLATLRAPHEAPGTGGDNTYDDRVAAAGRGTASKRSLTSLPSRPATQPAANQVANQAADDHAAAPLPADSNELLSAFQGYPPEVQREALRRLVATTAHSAERTSQPASPQDQLAARLDDLPSLPDSADSVSGPPAERLAAERLAAPAERARQPVSASLSDAGATPRPENPEQNQLTELPTSELPGADSQVAQAATRSAAAADEDQVQTAAPSAATVAQTSVAQTSVAQTSAAQTSVAQNTVAQASVEQPTVPSVPDAPVSPVSPAEPLSTDQLFEALLQQLATAPEGESEAERASRLIKLRHLMVLSGDPDSAVETIEGMSEAEQEYLRHHLLGLWTMIDPQGHPVPSRRFSTAMPQIRRAAQFAAAATDSLDVRSLAFCTEIESYGQIKKFDSNRFSAGQQVILYCEIENFTAEQTDQGYATQLQGSYDLFNDREEKVASQLLPADEQLSANYLRDYFIAYQMYLPENLPKGKYRLQLTMEDVKGKKYGQANIDLQIKP